MGALGGRQGCGDTGCTVPPMRRGRGSAFGPRLSLMPGPTGLHIPRLPSGTAASGPHPAPRDPSPQPREAEPVCAPASWPLGTALGTHGPSAQTLSVALSERVGSTGERVRDGGALQGGSPGRRRADLCPGEAARAEPPPLAGAHRGRRAGGRGPGRRGRALLEPLPGWRSARPARQRPSYKACREKGAPTAPRDAPR